jgi:hypothetical protein
MTAFLNVDRSRAHVVRVSPCEALRDERSALVSWCLIALNRQLVGRWRSGDRAPDVPPG